MFGAVKRKFQINLFLLLRKITESVEKDVEKNMTLILQDKINELMKKRLLLEEELSLILMKIKSHQDHIEELTRFKSLQ